MKKGDIERLQKMLLTDDLKVPGHNLEIVKNELFGVVESYFDVDEKSVEFIIRPREDGAYVFYFHGVASGAKKVRTMV